MDFYSERTDRLTHSLTHSQTERHYQLYICKISLSNVKSNSKKPVFFAIFFNYSKRLKMTCGFKLIYEKVPIGANLFKNAENDDLVGSMYVKSHFKQLLLKALFR